MLLPCSFLESYLTPTAHIFAWTSESPRKPCSSKKEKKEKVKQRLFSNSVVYLLLCNIFILSELNKNTQNMFRTKVLLTLLIFSSICPKLVEMLSQLSNWGLSNDFMLNNLVPFLSMHCSLKNVVCGNYIYIKKTFIHLIIALHFLA